MTIRKVNSAKQKLLLYKSEAELDGKVGFVNGWAKDDFIRYLKGTLIPDLKESGREFTAEDFETAIGFMEGV